MVRDMRTHEGTTSHRCQEALLISTVRGSLIPSSVERNLVR